MFKAGTTIGRNITEKTFIEIAEAGLSAVEIDGTGHDLNQFCHYANSAGVELYSMHLPYTPLNERSLAITDKQIQQKNISDFAELIRKGANVGISKFIIHPSTPLDESIPREEQKKYAMEALFELAEVAAKEGGELAVEDMITSCLGNSPDELLEIISVNDKLRICFDVNHLFGATHEEFIKKLGDKIIHTHISDYDFVEERHWLPGEGKIDWAALYNNLRDAGYNGVWNYEVAMRGPKFDERGRELTFADLGRNAAEIFSGKKPTVIRA